MDKTKLVFFLCALVTIFLIPSMNFAASFDCSKASSEVEKIICGNDELSKLDDSLNKAYVQALEWKDIKSRIIKSQRQWLKVRNACKNAECLKNAYQIRFNELGSLLPDGTAPRPPDRSTSSSEVNERLLRAAERGSVQRIKNLLTEGGDVNSRDRYGRTLLMDAAQYGHLGLVEFFIDKGVDVNAKDYSGRSVLTGAAKVGNFEIVKLLIDKGAEVSSTFLMFAATSGNLEIVKLLLDKGLDVNARDEDGKTVLRRTTFIRVFGRISAPTSGNLEIVKFLIDRGADVNAKTDYTVLMGAARSGNLELVKFLVDKGLDVNAKTETGSTTLIFATMNARMNGYSVVKLLIDKGADANTKNENGRTALMDAAERGDLEVAKLLIDKGADVNAKAKDGDTALKRAQRGNELMEQLLKAYGAKDEVFRDHHSGAQ
ncbi:MAG: ankyrin repeat domain-containing protein [Desulfomonilaceae bacterium]